MSKVTHTPGPWRWYGNNHDIYLAAEHSGRRHVMGFIRMGLNSAQPSFQVNGRMVPAADLVQFEVGNRDVRGFANGRRDQTVYRLDITGIDCPDARLIAAAPDMLEALEKVEAWLLCADIAKPEDMAQSFGDMLSDVQAAIAKAEGGEA